MNESTDDAKEIGRKIAGIADAYLCCFCKVSVVEFTECRHLSIAIALLSFEKE